VGQIPDSFISISQGNNHGSKLTLDGLSSHYHYYKTTYFPKLIDDKTISEYDKSLIRNMLTKPWNLYVFRHSALTEKSQILFESVFKGHAGWTMSSKMTQIYIHLSRESSKILLQKRRVIKKMILVKPLLLNQSNAQIATNPPDLILNFVVNAKWHYL
jgi:hypothetical protein